MLIRIFIAMVMLSYRLVDNPLLYRGKRRRDSPWVLVVEGVETPGAGKRKAEVWDTIEARQSPTARATEVPLAMPCGLLAFEPQQADPTPWLDLMILAAATTTRPPPLLQGKTRPTSMGKIHRMGTKMLSMYGLQRSRVIISL